MENKNTVIDAKIGNLNELTKVLSVKEQAQEQLLVVMKALGIGKIVRNLKFEKAQGYTLTSLFISLLIMRLWGKTIASATSNHFHGLCAVSKNTLYRALLNARIDWRMLLTKITLRFHAILREHQVNTDEHDTCAILDDTTFQKSGIRIEGVSKVFDHVTHSFIYGMKCLTLALSDGKSCYPIDFSLHREKGKKKDYGLTLKQRKEQFKEKRNAKIRTMHARRSVMRASLKWPDACFVMPWGMVSTSSMCLLTVGLHANRSYRLFASYVAVQCTILV